MTETLTEEKDNEEISIEEAQKISNKLENLREKKHKRIQEQIQDSKVPGSINSRRTKIGTVSNIRHLEKENAENEARIDIEYLNNKETEVESFPFKVPEDEEDIHIDNRLIRFINFVGDGSTVDLNKVMYRDVPLIIDENEDVEIDIPERGKISRMKNSLRRRSIDIRNKLDISVSIDSKSALYGITSILCMVVGFSALQTSIEVALSMHELSTLIMGTLLLVSLTAVAIGEISALLALFVYATTPDSMDYSDRTFSISFTLLTLILGLFVVNSGLTLSSGGSGIIEMAKYSSGFVLPVLSLVYSYIFLSESNISTCFMNKYRRISKRLKLNKGPEYLE
jgi:hypothetical protein